VFVEGAKTEEAYLTGWRREHRDVNLAVSDFFGPPLKLVRRAANQREADRRAARQGRGRAYDQYWCMFDVDEHHGLPEAISLAHDKSINVAVSNPNIELWFILHFEDQTGWIHRDAATTRAQELLRCGKRLTPDATRALLERYVHAAQRARQLDVKHAREASPPGENPSSAVWRLIEAIRFPEPPETSLG
jgi:hypothetical protein